MLFRRFMTGAAIALSLSMGACSSPDSPPRRDISQPPLPPYEAPTAPQDVEDWLEAHPNCLGDGEPLFRDATLAHGAWHMQPPPANDGFYEQTVGGGVAMADFDGDGDLDLYIGVSNAGNALLLNDGYGRFTRADWTEDVAFPDDKTNGVSAADYDNDGDQDLYLANKGPDRLLQNRGDGRFVDVTDDAGIDSADNSSTASWADLDGDGVLDLVVAVHGNDAGSDFVHLEVPDWYRGGADGRFEKMDESVFTEGATYIMPLVDLDADGDIDVLHTQEFGEDLPPAILENLGVGEGGELTWQIRPDPELSAVAAATMGAAFLDTEGNVYPDVYTTNLWGEGTGAEVLAVNAGDFEFTDRADELGAAVLTETYDVSTPTRAASWATVSADVQNDGHQDLFVAYGRTGQSAMWSDSATYPPIEPAQPDALLLGQEDGGFTLRDGACAESPGVSRGTAVGDLNGDGCLDLYVVPRQGSGRLLMNRCRGGGNYVMLDLVGTRSNRDAVGARVSLTAAGRTQRRWVTASSTSVFSSSPRRVHFGLGQADAIDRIEITWPDGTVQQLEDVKINAVHVIEQPVQ